MCHCSAQCGSRFSKILYMIFLTTPALDNDRRFPVRMYPAARLLANTIVERRLSQAGVFHWIKNSIRVII